ncbi:hypothetical protein GZD87_005099, partial [Escherichia coli]|nr:hypothetical protein [Escherichia coli]EFI9795426.1 hypothetical protein [Escherichia coli]
FFIVNLNRIRLYFSMFSLALSKVRNTKPRLQPTNGVFTFIHLVFVSSQDFVLSVRVSKPHFSAKYSAYLSIPQHASALSWSRRDTCP